MIPTGYEGMITDEVGKISAHLDSYIKTEVKIDSFLNEIKADVSAAYNSTDNSPRLNKNNQEISDSEYIKLRNLKSYKEYIDKKRMEYVNTTENAVDIMQSTENTMTE